VSRKISPYKTMAVAKAQKKVKPKAEKVHTKVLAQSKSVARKKIETE